MSLQNEVLKTVGAAGVLGGLYKASPEYAEKMRLKGLNKEEIYTRNLLDNAIREIQESDRPVSDIDVNRATRLYSHIGNLLEEQGKFDEALEHRKGEERFYGMEISPYTMLQSAQKSTQSVQNARVTKSMQSDMTNDLRDFYRQVRLGGTI